MGGRGFAALPAAIHKARGSYRADRHGPRRNERVGVAPERPGDLSAEAASCWDSIVPTLADAVALQPSDVGCLRRYCELSAMYLRAAAVIQEQGITDDAGRLRPEAGLMGALGDRLLRIEQQFGLTPASRSRLPAPEGDATGAENKVRFFARTK